MIQRHRSQALGLASVEEGPRRRRWILDIHDLDYQGAHICVKNGNTGSVRNEGIQRHFDRKKLAKAGADGGELGIGDRYVTR